MIVSHSPFHTVLVLLALDPRDESVVAALRALAGRNAVERVLLLHVEDQERGFLPRNRPPGPRPRALDERIADVAEQLPGLHVLGIHATGHAAEEVSRVIERESVDLLILGRDRSEGGKAAWGDHGLVLMRTADCPVLLVPNGSALRCERALVGVDFSENAVDALRLVVGLCEKVRAVAVVDPNAEGESEAEAREGVLDAWRRKVVETCPEDDFPPLEVACANGPADALLYAAAEADLVVIGSRGLTPLAAVLLGSTAERLGGRCNQPLLVFRKKGEHRGVFGALFRK